MHPLAFSAISQAIPKVIDIISDWFKPTNMDEWHKAGQAKKPVKKRPSHKKGHPNYVNRSGITRCHIKLTADQHDTVRFEKMQLDHENALREYGVRKRTQKELTDQLNRQFNLNKSESFYRSIWNGERPRPSK